MKVCDCGSDILDLMITSYVDRWDGKKYVRHQDEPISQQCLDCTEYDPKKLLGD